MIISRDKKISEAEKRVSDKESQYHRNWIKTKRLNSTLEEKNKQLQLQTEHIEKKKSEVDKLHKRQVEQLEALSGFSGRRKKRTGRNVERRGQN